MATKSIISASVSLPEVQMSANLNAQNFLESMHLVEVSQSPSELVQPTVGHIVSPVAKDDGGEEKVGTNMSFVDCPKSSFLKGV
nr:hypothetical protein CFP56_19815 [Quercus suber]